MKKLISLLLCVIMLFALCVASLAAYNEEPNTTYEFYIDGTGVNLRSGPGVDYFSGGILGYGDLVEKRYVNRGDGTYAYLFMGPDESGSNVTWWSVTMVSGAHTGDNGYVAAKYISSRAVTSAVIEF